MQSRKVNRVLVTGGHGFLGSHLVDLLLRRGCEVRCLLRPGRGEAGFRGLPVEVVRGDLRRAEGLEAAVEGVETVYHVAGLIAARRPADFYEVNEGGTRRLAAAVARANPGCRRFVLVSSQTAGGPSRDGTPVREEDPARPLSHYGRSKLAAERALPGALGGVPHAVLRAPAIYGPRDEAIFPFFQMARSGLRPGLEGRGRRFNLLHAEDVAEAILLAGTRGEARNRLYYLAEGPGCTHGEVGEALSAAYGRRLRRVPLPDLLLDLAGVLTDELAGLLGRTPVFGRDKAKDLKARFWVCSALRAGRELGWTPRITLQEGMAATARWYEEQGWIRARPGGRGPGAGAL
ncbi:MAG: NAD-dependent epimerase/dehydratase family protein [Planctomycetaceae bacterium]